MSSAANIQKHLKYFYHEANTMNADQTAPYEQSDLGQYCLLYIGYLIDWLQFLKQFFIKTVPSVLD